MILWKTLKLTTIIFLIIMLVLAFAFGIPILCVGVLGHFFGPTGRAYGVLLSLFLWIFFIVLAKVKEQQ